jgi:hypothetical protein
MRKFVNSIFIIILSLLFFGALIFEMSVIKVPVTYSFDASAEKLGNGYLIAIPENRSFNMDEKEMYISANKNEKVIKVSIEQHNGYFYFENQDLSYAESYNQTYTYEIVTQYISLLDCIFSRGGKTIE